MDKKTERLVNVARMYYEQDRTQSEIADRYGISRPMVSKLLKEARDRGIVTIRINAPKGESGGTPSLMELVGRCFGIYDGVAVPGGQNDQTTNEAVAEAALSYLSELGGASLGIGWGHIIGDVVKHMEQREKLVPIGTFVCPLIGNGGVGLKNYHSNELVRSIAEHSGAQPRFIYSPACVLSEQELKLTRELDSYHRDISCLGKAGCGAGQYREFSFGTGFCFGGQIWRPAHKAEGSGADPELFYGQPGTYHPVRYGLRHSDSTGASDQDKACGGYLFCQYQPKGIQGALKTGYLKHFIAPEHVVREALE